MDDRSEVLDSADGSLVILPTSEADDTSWAAQILFVGKHWYIWFYAIDHAQDLTF